MRNSSSKPVIIGIVGHIPPEFLADFKQYIESYSHFRLIRFQESDNKLWIVEQEGLHHDRD